MIKKTSGSCDQSITVPTSSPVMIEVKDVSMRYDSQARQSRSNDVLVLAHFPKTWNACTNDVTIKAWLSKNNRG